MSVLAQNISEMCIEANHYLSEDMKTAFTEAQNREQAPLGRQILSQLQENMEIAEKDMIPICQDTGMVVCASIRYAVYCRSAKSRMSVVCASARAR